MVAVVNAIAVVSRAASASVILPIVVATIKVSQSCPNHVTSKWQTGHDHVTIVLNVMPRSCNDYVTTESTPSHNNVTTASQTCHDRLTILCSNRVSQSCCHHISKSHTWPAQATAWHTDPYIPICCPCAIPQGFGRQQAFNAAGRNIFDKHQAVFHVRSNMSTWSTLLHLKSPRGRFPFSSVDQT